MRCSFPQARINKSDGSIKYHACGRCRACRRNQQLEWSFRAYVESLSYKNSVFITLTYNDEHLPKNASLEPTAIADFIKRLRYYLDLQDVKIRYFGAGEYGEKGHRPHYHLIAYGISIDNPVFYDKFYSEKKCGYWCFCKAWRDKKGNPLGEVFLGDVTFGTCSYVAKYLLKKKTGKQGQRYYKTLGVYPEFTAVSRCPGLGYDYLKVNFDLIKSRGYVLLKGHKVHLPRYYLEKVFENGTDEREEIKMRNQECFRKSWEEFFRRRKIGNKTEHQYMKEYLEQQEINLIKEEVK